MNIDDGGVAPRQHLSRASGSHGYPFWLDELVADMPRFGNPLCAEIDPALFYPEKNDAQTSRLAKSICRECKEIDACFDWAMTHDEMFGIWGATSARDRKKLRGGRA